MSFQAMSAALLASPSSAYDIFQHAKVTFVTTFFSVFWEVLIGQGLRKRLEADHGWLAWLVPWDVYVERRKITHTVSGMEVYRGEEISKEERNNVLIKAIRIYLQRLQEDGKYKKSAYKSAEVALLDLSQQVSEN